MVEVDCSHCAASLVIEENAPAQVMCPRCGRDIIEGEPPGDTERHDASQSAILDYQAPTPPRRSRGVSLWFIALQFVGGIALGIGSMWLNTRSGARGFVVIPLGAAVLLTCVRGHRALGLGMLFCFAVVVVLFLFLVVTWGR